GRGGQDVVEGQGRRREGGEAQLQGQDLRQGPGRLQDGRRRLRGQELLQGQGWLCGPCKEGREVGLPAGTTEARGPRLTLSSRTLHYRWRIAGVSRTWASASACAPSTTATS